MKKVILLLVCLMLAISLAACDKGDPESLKITPPTQLTYVVGQDALNLSGGKVGVKYTGGKVQDEVSLDHADVKLTYSLEMVGDAIPVKVEYKGLSATFDIKVEAPDNIASISVSTNPWKTSYGSSATVKNIEKRGGELNVKFNNGTADAKVPFSDPAVSIHAIDHVERVVTIRYKGLTATYGFTYDANEKAYVTFTELPDKTTFRDGIAQGQLREDVDFRGAAAVLEIQGTNMGAFKFDNLVKIVNVDLTRKYVTFERPLIGYNGYEKNKVTGTFDISTTSKWVQSFAIKTNPGAKIDAQKDLDSYSLAGGTATLTYNTGVTEDVSLTDARFAKDSLIYGPSAYDLADIKVVYDDEIANSAQIASVIKDITVENHNDVTKFNYYASQLTPFNELVWGAGAAVLDDDQIKWALEGFEKYLDFTPAQRTAVGENGKAVYANYYNHLRFKAYNEGWDEFDRRMETYRSANNDTNKARVLAQIETIADANDLLVSTFSTEKAKAINETIILYTLSEIDVEATNAAREAANGAAYEIVEKNVDKNINSDRDLITAYRDANLSPYEAKEGGFETVIQIAERLLEDFEETFPLTTDDNGDKYLEGFEDSAAIRELYTDKENLTGDALAQSQLIESTYNFFVGNNIIENKWSDETQKYEDYVETKDGTMLDSARSATYLLSGDDWFPYVMDIIYSYYYEPSHRLHYINVADNAVAILDDNKKLVKSAATQIEEARYFSIEKELDVVGEIAKLESENRNVEIYLLILKKIYAPIVKEAVDFFAAPLKSFAYGDNLRFLADYPQYISIEDRISELNYRYYATVETLYGVRGYADFFQNAIPSMYKDSAAAKEVAYKSSTMEDWLWAIGAYYDEVLYYGYGELLDDETFKDFLDDYLEVYMEYTPFVPMNNPYMELNEERAADFYVDFENIYTKFNKLKIAQQGAFFMKIDSSYSRFAKQILDQNDLIDARYATTYYGMMLEAYAAKNLSPDEFDIHYDVMNAYIDLAVMAYKGISTARLTSFISNVDLVNSKKDILDIDPEGYFARTEALRIVCADSYTELKKISSAGLSDVIDNLYNAKDFLRSFVNGGNDIDGFTFLIYRDKLNSALDEWRGTRLLDAALNDLKVYKMGTVSVFNQYEEVVKGYADEYEKYFAGGTIEYYQNLFGMGKKYVESIYITENYADYIQTQAFKTGVEGIFTEFNALIQMGIDEGTTSYVDRYWYLALSVNTLTMMVNDYYAAINKDIITSGTSDEKARAAAEVILAKNEVIAYYLYTLNQCLTDEEARETFGYNKGNPTANYTDLVNDIIPYYFSAVRGIETLYNDIEGGVSEATDAIKLFEGKNLTELYNLLMDRAMVLAQLPEYEHLVPDYFKEKVEAQG